MQFGFLDTENNSPLLLSESSEWSRKVR